ncbi:MAG: trigger factor [Brockia lithotrophica]|nr:trigger factor [Brockia lithotrophica]
MKVEFTRTGPYAGVLTVEVEADRFDRALEEAFRRVIRHVEVPGFRRGKVPRFIFEARYGVESLYEEALNVLLPEAYRAAVEEAGIVPIEEPEIDVESIGKGQPLRFKATVTVEPEAEVGDYRSITLVKPVVSVGEEEVERELAAMRERVAVLRPLEGEEAVVREGDEVDLAYRVFVREGEGEDASEHELEDARRDEVTVEVVPERLLPGFAEGLVGMRVGETKDIFLTLPQDYHDASLSGKPVRLSVHVKAVRRKEYPPLDDEFAREVSDFDTLEELKADIRAKLEARAREAKEREVRDAVVEKLVDITEVELPESLVRREAEAIVEELDNVLRSMGTDFAKYLEAVNKDREAVVREHWEEARRRVVGRLGLLAVARKEGIEIDEGRWQEKLAELARVYRTTPEELERVLRREGAYEALRRSVLFDQVVDRLLSYVTWVEEPSVPSEGEDSASAEGKGSAAEEK